MRGAIAVAALLGAGAAALAATYFLRGPSTQRPDASGEVGFVVVHGQLASGPIRLVPDREVVLPRPQDIVFQYSVRGTGPRIVRVEMIAKKERWVLHEERVQGPIEGESLNYVLHLGDAAEDKFRLIVTIEAPHAQSLVAEFPLQLGPPS